MAMPRWKRVLCWSLMGIAVGVGAIGGGLAVWRLRDVHHRYGVWSLDPGAGTPKIVCRGRTYIRGSGDPSGFPGDVPICSTPGGGVVMVATDSGTPTVVLVTYPDGTKIVYSLSGGP